MLTYYRTFGDAYPNRACSDYVINPSFSYALDGKNTLITTSHGGWVILNRDEYNLLFEGSVEKDTNLYAILEGTGIILTRNNQMDVLRGSCQKRSYLNRAPNRLILWSYGKESGESDNSFEEIGFKSVDFFLSIPQLDDRVYIEFRGEFLSQYPFIQKIMNYAMAVGWREKKEVLFTIVSSPYLMTDEIALDMANRRVRYQVYFDGSNLAIDGMRKIGQYKLRSVQLLVFPLDYIGQEARLVNECIALGLNRITIKYADSSHSVEKYRKTNLTSEEYYDFWKETLELVIEYNRNGISLVEGQTRELLQNIILPGSRSTGARRPCGAGISQLVVDLRGRILACYCADWLEMGNIFTDTYNEVITAENGVGARCLTSDLLPKCSTCAFNAYCGHCPVQCLQQHGSSLLEEPDDFECRSYIRMIPYLFKKLGNVEDAKILTKWV